MNKFLGKQNLPKPEEIEDQSSCTFTTESEFMTKNHFTKKTPGPGDFTGKLSQHLKST